MARSGLTNADVYDLASSSAEALQRVGHLVHATLGGPFGRRGGKAPIREADIASTALYDAMTAVLSGQARDGATLTRVVQRSVWREVKRAQRLHEREELVDIDRLTQIPSGAPSPFDELARAESSAVAHLSKVDLLYRETKRPTEEAQARIDLVTVDDELIKFLAAHPEHMYNISPRRFEELVAAILRDLGYEVSLTGLGPDGGVDIFATRKTGVGDTLLLVDCKRHAPQRPVGVSVVRALFGITEQLRATMGLLATTSYFTQPAREFQQSIKHRLSLRAFDDLLAWLRQYRQQTRPVGT